MYQHSISRPKHFKWITISGLMLALRPHPIQAPIVLQENLTYLIPNTLLNRWFDIQNSLILSKPLIFCCLSHTRGVKVMVINYSLIGQNILSYHVRKTTRCLVNKYMYYNSLCIEGKWIFILAFGLQSRHIAVVSTQVRIWLM